mmetsp:Transcript_117735/g.375299  ORF Transcript_117735/g.375299 Transcript_117735/m.375299 type:complete len:301 (+) Transcript_117735:190-1092(+)
MVHPRRRRRPRQGREELPRILFLPLLPNDLPPAWKALRGGPDTELLEGRLAGGSPPLAQVDDRAAEEDARHDAGEAHEEHRAAGKLGPLGRCGRRRRYGGRVELEHPELGQVTDRHCVDPVQVIPPLELFVGRTRLRGYPPFFVEHLPIPKLRSEIHVLPTLETERKLQADGLPEHQKLGRRCLNVEVQEGASQLLRVEVAGLAVAGLTVDAPEGQHLQRVHEQEALRHDEGDDCHGRLQLAHHLRQAEGLLRAVGDDVEPGIQEDLGQEQLLAPEVARDQVHHVFQAQVSFEAPELVGP